MAKPLPTIILTGTALLASLLLAGLVGAAKAAPAQAATASGACSGVTVASATRTVRAGGRVQITGRACGAGSASAGRAVQVKVRKGKRWAPIAKTTVSYQGTYSVCAKVRVPRKAKVARVQAVGPGGKGVTTLRVTKKARSKCGGRSQPTSPPAAAAPPPVSTPPAPAPPPPLDPPGSPDCELSKAQSDLGFTISEACRVVASDTSSNPNPIPFWGRIDCQTADRHRQVPTGGDAGTTATGAPQGDDAYRRMTVYDGDNYWGERCELGVNDHSGPVAFYREGQRRVTYASFRLPNNLPINADKWQGVLQMKQGQSSDNGGGTPVLSLSVFDGRWSLWHSDPGPTNEDFQLWSAPAKSNVWTRVAIDAHYSQYADKGWVRIYIDLNGDGDFGDAGERSQTFRTNTLKHETGTDASDGLVAGDSIPSHLRVGMYHHQDIPCPTITDGCSVEADNIQVVAP